MSSEATTTTLDDIVNAEIIEASFLGYPHEHCPTVTLSAQYSVIGRSSPTISLPRIDTAMGTLNDGGSGVDTEFNATEGTDLANTAMTTSQVGITAAEFGVMRTITDTVLEDSVMTADQLYQAIFADAQLILMTALEDDMVALFGSVTAYAGSTGSDLTLANMMSAVTALRKAGARFPGGAAFVLDEQQVTDFDAALVATGSSWAVYQGTADKAINYVFQTQTGEDLTPICGFRGYPVFFTGLTPTANTAADVVGCLFVPGNVASNQRFSAFGTVTAREFRIGLQRDESLRATEIVATMRKGVALLSQSSAVAIITDA